MNLNRSILFAAGLAIILIIWMLTGIFKSDDDAKTEGPVTHERQLFEVLFRDDPAESIMRDIVVSGRSAPAREVMIRAETMGRVESIGAKRGSLVEKGEVIAKLDMRDRQERLKEAQTLLEQREIEAQASQRLSEQQLQSESVAAQSRAAVENARALVRQIELEIENTTIEAPFAGKLASRTVEVGDYVQPGGEIATVVELDPLVIEGYITEKEIEHVHVGDTTRVELETGENLEGTIRYVAPVVDPGSRTYLVEVEAPNPDSKIPAGVSARLKIPTEEVLAHHISPAIVTLDDAGAFGLKLLDENNRVLFQEIELVKTTPDGIYVSGLPKEARIIVRGQNFAVVGEEVKPQPEDSKRSRPAKGTGENATEENSQ